MSTTRLRFPAGLWLAIAMAATLLLLLPRLAGSASAGEVAAPKPPTTGPAKAGASTDVVQVAFTLPAGFVGETKAVGAGWAGGWTSPEGVNLLVSLSPRPTPGAPYALERAVKASVPMLISKPCPGMKISETQEATTFAGYRFLGQRLSGTSKTGPLVGMAGLADVESATISLVAYGPEKAFNAAWPEVVTSLNQMKVTQPAAAAPKTQPATRPAIAVAGGAGSGGSGAPVAGEGKPFVFGHFTFTPPAGWTVKQDAKRVVLTPEGGAAGNPAAMVTLLSPVSLKGEKLADWMATFTEAAHKEAAVRQKRDPKAAEGPGGAGVITQVFVIQAKGASRVEYRVYAAMAAGENVQAILFASPEAADFQAHLPMLQKLIETAKPVKP